MNILLIVPRNVINATSKNGIGTYLAGTKRMCEKLKIGCDVISEDVPKTNNFYKYHGTEFIAPEAYYSLSEKILDRIFSKHYEMIVSSTLEGLMCLVSMEIHKLIPVFYRTHSSPFTYLDVKDMQLRMRLLDGIIRNESPHINLLVQAKRPAKLLSKRLPEGVKTYVACNYSCSLEETTKKTKTSGVLYIARYQDLKNVEHFAATLGKAKLSAKIMTSSPTSASRWKKLLDKNNVEHDVRYGLQGQEKVDFIGSARVAVQWSLSEQISNAVLECVPHCPTALLKTKNGWHKDYKEFSFYDKLTIIDPDNAVSELKRLYKIDTSDYRKSTVNLADEYNAKACSEWLAVLKDSSKYPPSGRVGKSELADILNKGETLDVKEYMKDMMYRKLKQLYTYHYTKGLKVKNSRVRAK